MKILITSGGTKVPIDTVRHIGNMSSGTFGSRIAGCALEAGHEVDLLYAKGSKTPFDFSLSNEELYLNSFFNLMKKVLAKKKFIKKNIKKIKLFEYSNFSEYETKLMRLCSKGNYDAVILAAAASDYGVDPIEGKIRSGDDLTIRLKPLPKLISRIKNLSPNSILVGFKLLVNSTDEELITAAKDSIKKNGCDVVIANDLRDIKNSNHRVFHVSDCLTLKFEANDYPEDRNYLAREVINTVNNIAVSKGVV